jgi:uncharacterized protein with PIN domain
MSRTGDESVNTAVFRFYADLNFFLPPERRQVAFAYHFKGAVAVKHLIEALGVPHTEVSLILANGESVGFYYPVQDGATISVYPALATLDVSPLEKVRPPWPDPPRFIADNHLGRLVRYLRLLGFDTWYGSHMDDPELAQLASEQQRILLTRDRGLLMRSVVTYGYCVRTRDSRRQLLAVMRRFNLFDQIAPWQRCLRCNGLLAPVAKEAILDRLEPKTKLFFDEFRICQSCEQIYWQGSHYGRLTELVEEVKRAGTVSAT